MQIISPHVSISPCTRMAPYGYSWTQQLWNYKCAIRSGVACACIHYSKQVEQITIKARAENKCYSHIYSHTGSQNILKADSEKYSLSNSKSHF